MIFLILILIGLIYFYVIKYLKINFELIYSLPFVWVIIYVTAFKLWNFDKKSILIFFHYFVIFSAIYSFILYFIYKKCEFSISLNDHDAYKGLGNLMFKSENYLYLALYFGIALLCIDLFVMISSRKRLH
jgi:hypothetical protein